MDGRIHERRLRTVVVLVLAGVFAIPAGVAASDLPRPTMASDQTRDAPAPYVLDLYRTGAFVGQTNFVQCVGASMQMMLNLIGPRIDTTPGTQLRLYTLARSFRPPSTSDSQGHERQVRHQGASAQGWALGLASVGAGPYRVAALPTLDAALRAAAAAIATTGRPVGLLVWQGQHAWVMSGFAATGDPTSDLTARVTGVRILDPLYPSGSGTWGPTPTPDALLSVPRLARTFVPYRPHARTVGWRSRFVVVLPFDATPGVRSRPVAG